MNALSKVVQAFSLLPIKEEQAEKALPEAAREGDLATLTRLVEEGVNLEASNYSGITALMKAAALGKLDCLDHLVAKGANVNAQDSYKRTALHYAASWHHARCVASLLKAGADTSLKDDINGKTALDLAKQFSDTKVLQLLENSVLLTYRRVRRRSAGERETMHKTAARRVASVCVGEACVGVWVCPGCAPGPPKEISAF
jgi:ankyrin repeat protein|tara:strand:- start:139 stop:738 length:600 start_codon:yes stop_codon:yes gene_type:complete